jgi:manganese oxidase
MGERGMADMAEMTMPQPDDTAPMMSGDGPFGSVEMGGMFTLLKVRRAQKPGDCKDPGWFRHSAGTITPEWIGALAEPARVKGGGYAAMPARNLPASKIDVSVRKPPAGKGGHAGH